MHPRSAALIAFCDGEAGRDQNRRIASHAAKCAPCRDQLRRIRSEKDELAASAARPAMDTEQGLAEVLSAMACWRESGTGAGQSELRIRLRRQIEMYFGSPAVLAVERAGMLAEELLGKASELFDVFLGPAAAEAVRDEVLGGLDGARLPRGTCR
jgi:anti-sigma factor ChrR (cupin superfamily)